MTENYREVDEEINRTKYLVSSFDNDTQKKVALCMWDYVYRNLDELYNMLTDEEIDSGNVDYGYDAVERIKQDFCEEFEKDTGLTVDWDNYCILCHHVRLDFSVTSACNNCPLKTCAAHTDNPYHTLVEYAFHNTDRNSALSAIDTIVEAIKGAEL